VLCVKSPYDVLVSNAIPALLNNITVKSDIQQLGQSTRREKKEKSFMAISKKKKKKSQVFRSFRTVLIENSIS